MGNRLTRQIGMKLKRIPNRSTCALKFRVTRLDHQKGTTLLFHQGARKLRPPFRATTEFSSKSAPLPLHRVIRSAPHVRRSAVAVECHKPTFARARVIRLECRGQCCRSWPPIHSSEPACRSYGFPTIRMPGLGRLGSLKSFTSASLRASL